MDRRVDQATTEAGFLPVACHRANRGCGGFETCLTVVFFQFRRGVLASWEELKFALSVFTLARTHIHALSNLAKDPNKRLIHKSNFPFS